MTVLPYVKKRVFVNVILLRWGDSEREAEVSGADLKISLFNNYAVCFADGEWGPQAKECEWLREAETGKTWILP